MEALSRALSLELFSYTWYVGLGGYGYGRWVILTVFQGFFVFCGFQAFLHIRESRRGAITLS